MHFPFWFYLLYTHFFFSPGYPFPFPYWVFSGIFDFLAPFFAHFVSNGIFLSRPNYLFSFGFLLVF